VIAQAQCQRDGTDKECGRQQTARLDPSHQRRDARKPLFALKLAKEAVNAAQDAQGRAGAMQTAFAYHQLSHAHNMQTLGTLIDTRGIMSKNVDYNAKIYDPAKGSTS